MRPLDLDQRSRTGDKGFWNSHTEEQEPGVYGGLVFIVVVVVVVSL